MNNLRIRKLTPTECFRLMGVKDEDSEKLNHLSNSVKYHLAGDSIVVNVLETIFKSILIDNPIVDKKPIRLIEFFAGYGSQALALKYLGIPFEHYVTCEWAIKSIDAYKHIHFPNVNEDYTDLMDKDDLVDFLYEKGISSNWNELMAREQIARKNENELREIYNNCAIIKNLINIQQVHGQDLKITERERFNYVLTYSFPCQDLSLAGKGAGMEKGRGTRSGMLWEVERILDELGDELPQILLMENVPQVVGKKNKEHFDKWVDFLESKGYTNKYCMLNAKEVGYPEPIPQNRNRCFMISVLNPRCDIVFPEKTERTMVLKDLLEENVDEKYYLTPKQINSIKNATFESTQRRIQKDDYCSTLCARDYKDPKCVDVNRLGGIFDTEKSTHQAGSVYDKHGLSPTLDTMSGGYRQPCIIDYEFGNKAVKETLENNKTMQDGSFMDCYNRNIRNDGLSGTISTGVDSRNNTFVITKDTENYIEWREKGKLDSDCRAAKEDKVSLALITTPKAKVLIKNATKQGYLEAYDGDGVNISSRMKNQRGNVQKGMTQTITTSGGNERGVVLEEKWADLD